jgi:hypothetical protein
VLALALTLPAALAGCTVPALSMMTDSGRAAAALAAATADTTSRTGLLRPARRRLRSGIRKTSHGCPSDQQTGNRQRSDDKCFLLHALAPLASKKVSEFGAASSDRRVSNW